MMLPPDKLRRIVSQAPLKPVACASGCGEIVFYRTSSKVYCAPCRVVRIREKDRRAAERQRRKRGVSKIKGTEIQCALCSKPIIRAGRLRRYCRECAPKGLLQRRYELWAKKPELRISSRLANAIGLSLKGRKAGRRWESLVGYKLPDLMHHLERQFARGMSWDNYGDWEIDHVQPLSSFKFSDAESADFRAAWALTNLRPLWKTLNRRKHATRTNLL